MKGFPAKQVDRDIFLKYITIYKCGDTIRGSAHLRKKCAGKNPNKPRTKECSSTSAQFTAMSILQFDCFYNTSALEHG